MSVKLENIYGVGLVENQPPEEAEENVTDDEKTGVTVEDVGVHNPNLPPKPPMKSLGIVGDDENESPRVRTATIPTTEQVGNKLMDDFILSLGQYYQPAEMEKYNFKDNIENELYGIAVSQDNVEEVILKAFREEPDRISFSTEELGLHNRLTHIEGVVRDHESYVIVKTELGDIIVSKDRVRPDGEAVAKVKGDIRNCIALGKRIDVNLLEQYEIEDGHALKSERFRFRLSLSEIKQVIAETQMRGIISSDCHLVIYE